MKKMMFLVAAILFFSSCAAKINPNYQSNQNQQNENSVVPLQENKNGSLAENANTVDDGNLNSNAYPCPQYAPPPPNWCSDGVIVPQGKDAHGCPLPATCEKRSENNNNNAFSRVRKEGEMCGGIAAFPCEEGLICKYDGSYPDAGGTCVKESGTDGNNANGSDPMKRESKINELCGGFTNKPCETGLECVYGPKGSDAGTCAKPNPNKNGVCMQVIAFAKDPRTGACWQFPTPCDVPVGWATCNNTEIDIINK